jgi:hypothetical protein
MRNTFSVVLLVLISLTSNAQGEQNLSGKPDLNSKAMGNKTEALPDACKLQNEYEEMLSRLNTKETNFIELYASNPNLNEEEADVLAKKWLRNDVATEKLKRKYYRKLKRATSPSLSSKYLLYDDRALEGCP